MNTMKNSKDLDNQNRIFDIEKKDWERYVQLFETKKIKNEEKKERDEKRNKLKDKFKDNIVKMDKETK